MDECVSSSVNFLLLSTLISIVLAADLSQNEQIILGNFLQMVGQNLTSMTTIYDLCIQKNSDTTISSTTN